MPFHIRDRKTDSLVRELASKRGLGLTETVKLAVQNELERERNAVPLRTKLGALRAQVLKRPTTGEKADKAFFDDLSGDS